MEVRPEAYQFYHEFVSSTPEIPWSIENAIEELITFNISYPISHYKIKSLWRAQFWNQTAIH